MHGQGKNSSFFQYSYYLRAKLLRNNDITKYYFPFLLYDAQSFRSFIFDSFWFWLSFLVVSLSNHR